MRVIFDTGIWARIARDDLISEIRSALAGSGHSIVLPPSVLLEVLRTPRADYRDRDVRAMISSGGRRLPSEAELCSNEFVKAVRRYRPHWQRKKTDYRTVNYYHHYWTNEIWDLAETNSAEAHRRAGLRFDELAPEIVAHQRSNRREFIDTKFHGEYVHTKYQWTRNTSPFGLRPGQVVDMWRLDVGVLYWFHLAPEYQGKSDETMRDWCGAYVDLATATQDSSDFGRFWLDDVDVSDVKRDWLQSAVRWTQTHVKIASSNPVDEQHSAYLLDADAFISADRRLVDVLHDVREQAPFDFAEPVYLDREAPGAFVDMIISALA